MELAGSLRQQCHILSCNSRSWVKKYQWQKFVWNGTSFTFSAQSEENFAANVQVEISACTRIDKKVRSVIFINAMDYLIHLTSYIRIHPLRFYMFDWFKNASTKMHFVKVTLHVPYWQCFSYLYTLSIKIET